MSKRLNLPRALGIFIVGISLSSISEGHSQTTNYFTWNNSTNLWSTTSAWNPNWANGGSSSSSGNTNVAVFAATGAENNSVLLGDNRTVYGLIFTNGANAYTLGNVSTPRQLDIMSGIGLQNASGQNQIFNLSVANNGTGLWTNSAGSTTTFNNGLNLTTASSSANRTLTLGGAGTWNVASAIANGGTATAGAVTVTATGTTTFSGNNTYDGLTTMNAAGGTLTLSGDNSGAAGGVTLTAGTLNINNNNALGSGALSLAGAGARINNTSGSAVVNAGNQGWTWSDGLAFGAATNTAANDLNLGTGVVTVAGSRTIALEGTGTKLTMGAANITSTSSGRTITANGVGNTLEMGGLTLSGNTTAAVTVTLAGTANLGITGAIVNGQAFANGVNITGTGTTTFSGNNTYTGLTTISAGTLVLSGANSSSGYTMAGSVDNVLPVLRVGATNALNTSATLLGASSSIKTGTLEFAAAGDYTLNQYLGSNMNFSNSSGSATKLTFTNANNILTASSGTSGGRTLLNNSANLDVVFSGNMDIGSSATNNVTLGGAGDFRINGAVTNGGTGIRGLQKTGDGKLTLAGSGNNYNGDTLVDRGSVNLLGSIAGSTNVVVSTAGTSSTLSTPRTASATLTVASGGSLASESTTTVYSRGNLIVNGTAGGVSVENNGLLGGSGAVGAVTLKSGSFLTPGNSPGTLTAASSTWGAGSTYNWEIDQASGGTAGVNWDLFSVVGALNLSALSSGAQMNLVLNSLSSMDDFSSTTEYSWVIAQAGSFIGNDLANGTDVTSLFNISSANFNSGVGPNGGFKVEVGTDANNLRTLNLMAVPEPSTSSMLGIGLAGLVATRLLRRKSS